MLLDGVYQIRNPSGKDEEEFSFKNLEIPGVLLFAVTLRNETKGQYILATNSLFYIDESCLSFEIRKLGAISQIFRILRILAFQKHRLRHLKWLIKGWLRKNRTDWYDIFVDAYQTSFKNNVGRFVDDKIEFEDGSSIPLLFGRMRTGNPSGKKIALFAHWDPDGDFSEADRKSLRILRFRGYYSVVISTNLRQEKISSVFADEVIVRPNAGHDFASWRTAYFLLRNEIQKAEKLVFINNSASIEDESYFDLIETKTSPVVCITEHGQLPKHPESYFYQVNLNRWDLNLLDRFWYTVNVLHSKRAIIESYEIGFGVFLSDHGVAWESTVPFERLIGVLTDKKTNYTAIWKNYRNDRSLNSCKAFYPILSDLGVGILKKFPSNPEGLLNS